MFKKASFRMRSMQNDAGFTLLEVIIALAILAFGILAIATMQVSSIQGNSQAKGLTEAVTLAQDKIEELMSLPYDDPTDPNDPLDDVDTDGSSQDANDDGVDDDGGNFGLDDTVNGGGTVIADTSEANGRYTIYWNVAVNEPIANVKTVRVIVAWSDRGAQKRASLDLMKTDVI